MKLKIIIKKINLKIKFFISNITIFLKDKAVRTKIIKDRWHKLKKTTSFIVLLYSYSLQLLFTKTFSKKFKKVQVVLNSLDRFNSKLDKPRHSITRRDLILLAFKNMKSKLNRTLVTLGGMVVSIAVIVLLLSVGFGLQKMIIDRIAKLDEMKQISLLPQAGQEAVIDDSLIANIKNIENVKEVLPVISVVAKLDYKQSNLDLAAYGVTHDYLDSSSIKISKGVFFDNNEIVYDDSKKDDTSIRKVYEIGQESRQLRFGFKPGVWLKVYKTPNIESPIIGYTQSQGTLYQGTEIWGSSYIKNFKQEAEGYDKDNNPLALWLSAKLPIWDNSQGQYIQRFDSNNQPSLYKGYVTKVNTTIKLTQDEGQIRKEGDRWIEIFNEDQTETTTNIVDLPDKDRVILLNKAALNLLNTNESKIVNKNIKLKLIANEGFNSKINTATVESTWLDYKIIGITTDKQNPVVYLPFMDLREMGINQYSQLRVMVDNKKHVDVVRSKLEAFGFTTNSVMDTINSVNKLFTNLRIFLTIVGSVALFVAGLGMFNTLTISLLERSREVGTMKAMGMTSGEVYEMFMVESLTMGLVGGVGGLVVGFIFAKLLEITVSVFSIFKSIGYISLVRLPVLLIFFVMLISLVVGWLTGIYPAKRAKKISALDALRYE